MYSVYFEDRAFYLSIFFALQDECVSPWFKGILPNDSQDLEYATLLPRRESLDSLVVGSDQKNC